MIARHACGGAIWAHLALDQDPDTTLHHLWCDGCRAFAPAGEPFPAGTDAAANRAAWEAGEPRSAGDAGGCPMCGCAAVASVADFGPGRILRRCRACGWDRMDGR